ncbi:MAG: methyltransferase domain-containing protein [Planctomycetaceae bacterium]
MLKQTIKDVYFGANRCLVMPNTVLARIMHRGKKKLYLHLGSGDDYREGMINVDGNIARKKDIWLDLRNRLPFQDRSARLIYCCHTLEHLFPEDAIRVLKEMYRVIADDGVVRLAVPGFERCLDIVAGRAESRWPRDFEDPVSQAINYIYCDGQHKYAYCFDNMRVFAEQSGFRNIYDYSAEHGVAPRDYDHITLGNENPGSLIVELRR